jgi:hypothetical protein
MLLSNMTTSTGNIQELASGFLFPKNFRHGSKLESKRSSVKAILE